MAANFKNLLDKGIASVTVKSSTFLETSKLSNQINMAEAEIPAQKKLMADAIYAAWQAQENIDEVAQPFCRAIETLEWQITELQQKIAQVREDSQKTLGTEATRAEVTAQAAGGNVFCCSCGAENVATAHFCCKCGSKME